MNVCHKDNLKVCHKGKPQVCYKDNLQVRMGQQGPEDHHGSSLYLSSMQPTRYLFVISVHVVYFYFGKMFESHAVHVVIFTFVTRLFYLIYLVFTVDLEGKKAFK